VKPSNGEFSVELRVQKKIPIEVRRFRVPCWKSAISVPVLKERSGSHDREVSMFPAVEECYFCSEGKVRLS
jgi:hypothetical protein